MDSNAITALATGLLAIVGDAQIGILKSQRRQSQLALIEEYRRRGESSRRDWGPIIFIGRDENTYYQVAGKDQIEILVSKRNKANNYEPTIWALDAARTIFINLSDVCT
jgi:hypothetical protein